MCRCLFRCVCALLPMCCYSVPNSKCKVNKLFYSHFKSPALSMCSIFSVPLALLFFVCDASVPLPLLPLLLLPPFHSAIIHSARISCPLFFLDFSFILFFFFLIFCRLLMMTTVEDSQCDTEISESVDSFFEHYFLLLKKECLITQFFIQQ